MLLLPVPGGSHALAIAGAEEGPAARVLAGEIRSVEVTARYGPWGWSFEVRSTREDGSGGYFKTEQREPKPEGAPVQVQFPGAPAPSLERAPIGMKTK